MDDEMGEQAKFPENTVTIDRVKLRQGARVGNWEQRQADRNEVRKQAAASKAKELELKERELELTERRVRLQEEAREAALLAADENASVEAIRGVMARIAFDETAKNGDRVSAGKVWLQSSGSGGVSESEQREALLEIIRFGSDSDKETG